MSGAGMSGVGMNRLGIVGAGAWGTALALLARRAGKDALLWAYEPELVDEINRRHENAPYLPGVTLDPAIRATGDLAELARADAIFLVTPAQNLRALVLRLATHLAKTIPLVICAKGIEESSGALMTEIVAAALPSNPLAVLSGPGFALEIARDLPTAVTLACRDADLGKRLVDAIGNRHFRPYLGDDPVGAEIGGAVKNVIAIACGIVQGRKLGDNARAALITRGLAEMARLGAAKGAKPATFMGLSGLGDLTLTCNATQSRNFSLGVALGEGRTLEAALRGRRSVAEGVATAASVAALARKLGVEMPIAAAVDGVLHRALPIDATIERLLARPLTSEGLAPPAAPR
ncbi:MAG TPA: NAD(P)H-dependent glycerol-3-phosphate dehydrogenase [Alphaproteobacteria bacterium]|nr:NAD(P)H-dependent glycerol-3-phosphate dehydrogenase [Alphaproteobacteria bacterium]